MPQNSKAPLNADTPSPSLGSAAAPPRTRYRILLVEDHPLMRQGMKALLSRNRGFEVCGEADSPEKAMELIAKHAPNLAIVDITLKSANGLDLTRDIRAKAPGTQVLVVSMHEENIYAEKALKAGAMGYLMKDEAAEKIIIAIDCILQGEIFVSDSIKRRFVPGTLRT